MMNFKATVRSLFSPKPFPGIEDKALGCIMGGAIGDALGYPVEFCSHDDITKQFGIRGITSYVGNRGEISDDTQMTLFTIEGLVSTGSYDIQNIFKSYRNWHATQTYPYSARQNYAGYSKESKLLNTDGLYQLMSPGGTCLSALGSGKMGTIETPINNSKGCGGIMRVAPIGVYFTPHSSDLLLVAKAAAETAAITHGHPFGYIPAAILACMLNLIIYHNCLIKDSLTEAIKVVDALYPETKEIKELVGRAMKLSENRLPDVDNIHELGGGWVAEETLAIALYCCLRYPDNFEKVIIAAVNHSGDSDSTGAVTGNIIGAILGCKKIPHRYLKNLEMRQLIKEMTMKLISCTERR